MKLYHHRAFPNNALCIKRDPHVGRILHQLIIDDGMRHMQNMPNDKRDHELFLPNHSMKCHEHIPNIWLQNF